ncbi:MAG: DUF4397 domain-containing protein [Anaerolineae bacterium]|nr:DUF4397 domain-containing protein [Anaerolineae bacterium]
MNRSKLWIAGWLLVMLAACMPAPTPTPTAEPTVTLTPTLAPAPSPTPTVGPVPQRTGAEAEDEGRLRVIHAASESGAVDVYLEQGLLAGRFGYGAITNPTSITTGTYYLQVVPVGAIPDSQVLADTTLAIEADHSYIVLLSGTAETLIISVYQEDLSTIPAKQARIAFLNAVPRGPNVTARVGNQPFADVLGYGQVSAGYHIDAAAQTVAFFAGERELASYQAALAPQQTYTAVLIGKPGAEETRILLLNSPVLTPGQVRFVHAAPEMGSVSVRLNAEIMVEALDYRENSGWQAYIPRSHTLEIRSVDNGELLAETRFNLAANQAVEIVLLKDRGRPALRLFPHSLAPTAPRTAHLVVVNAAPYAPALYGQTRTTRLDAIPLVPGGANTRVVAFPASTLEMLWVSGEGSDSRVIEWAGEVTFLAGHAYTYIITGEDRNPLLLSTEVGLTEDVQETPAAETTTLRITNAIAEPVTLRVRLGETLLLEGLPHQETVQHPLTGSEGDTLRVGAAEISPNLPDYLIATLDPIQEDSFLLLYSTLESMAYSLLSDHNQTLQQGHAALRVINGMVEEDSIYIRFALPGILPTAAAEEAQVPATLDPAFQDSYQSPPLAPGHATEYLTLPLNMYDIYAMRASDDEVLAIVPRLALEAQTIYDLVLMPAPYAEGYEVLLLRTPAGAD